MMARSSNVYVVFEIHNDPYWAGGEWVESWELTPLAGFTVKYEMEDWLREKNRTSDDTTVYRMRDGGEGEPVELEWPLYDEGEA
ncbi:MAG: hypothetical protein ACYSWO_28985 [Planctomycetota bacterium]|jgi:hypothetical protein